MRRTYDLPPGADTAALLAGLQAAQAVGGLGLPRPICVVQRKGAFQVDWDVVEGLGLNELMALAPPSARVIVRIFAELSRALGSAHNAGVAHGATSLEQIHISRAGTASILGLGFGPLLDSAPATPAGDMRRLRELLLACLTRAAEHTSDAALNDSNRLTLRVLADLRTSSTARRATGPAAEEELTLAAMLDELVQRHGLAISQDAVASAVQKAMRTRRAPSAPVAVSGTPGYTSPLRGRDRLLGELMAWYRNPEPPCLVLVGPPGAGKTRLAAALCHATGAETSTDAEPVWCSLATALTAEAACRLVSRAVGAPMMDTPGTLEQARAVACALRARPRPVLVLDAVEAVAAPLRRLIDGWTASVPEVRLIITTRERLNLGDAEYVAVGALRDAEARQLFLDAAAVAQPGWALTGEDSDRLRILVHALDGLPGPIELAAGAIGQRTVGNLVRMLRQRGRAPDACRIDLGVERSWRLLPAPERRLLREATVFEAEFTGSDARSVLSRSDNKRATDLLSRLASLHSRSLIRIFRSAGGKATRFRIYRSVRAFAAAQPAASSTLGPTIERHALWHLRLALGPLANTSTEAWAAEVTAYRRDLEAVFRRSLARSQTHSTALHRALAVATLLADAGHAKRALSFLDAALDSCATGDTAASVEAHAHLARAQLLLDQGEVTPATEAVLRGRLTARWSEHESAQARAEAMTAALMAAKGEASEARAAIDAMLAGFDDAAPWLERTRALRSSLNPDNQAPAWHSAETLRVGPGAKARAVERTVDTPDID